jgi:cytidine deaminase
MLTSQQISVIIAAIEGVRQNAHAPYSGYRVGAAVVTEDERVYFGCNVENASYGLSLCAERVAIASAIAAGAKKIVAVVVVTDADPPGTPCGACRQWLAEFADSHCQIVCANPNGNAKCFTLGELLPESFSLH